jgi:hypothetical protein
MQWSHFEGEGFQFQGMSSPFALFGGENTSTSISLYLFLRKGKVDEYIMGFLLLISSARSQSASELEAVGFQGNLRSGHYSK